MINHEIFDGEIIESVGNSYESCFFFDCEIKGSSNVFSQCTFQWSSSFPDWRKVLTPHSTYTQCLFYAPPERNDE